MTIFYLGSLSVGGAVPGCDAAVSAGISGIGSALDDLVAQLGMLTAYVPTPISFATQLTQAEAMVTALGAAISLGLPPPDITAQIAALASKIAGLTAQIAGITANLTVLTDLQAPLTAAGVHGYGFDGAVNALGGELASELSGGAPGGAPSDHGNAVVFLTTIPGTWAAMGEVFKVTP
jgi:hypothetical protein